MIAKICKCNPNNDRNILFFAQKREEKTVKEMCISSIKRNIWSNCVKKKCISSNIERL